MTAHREHERRWPASVAVLAVLGLQVVLPHQIVAGPWWLTPALELILLLPLVVTNPVRLTRETAALRGVALLIWTTTWCRGRWRLTSIFGTLITDNSVLVFWAAYVLTRPFRASLGDFLTAAPADGGLGLGTNGTSAIFPAVIVTAVAWFTVEQRRADRASRQLAGQPTR